MLQKVMRDFAGPLTHELLLKPGNFGLGRIPKGLQADTVTPMICGYCSTGCSLKIHLKGGQAVGLSPDPEYPVNLGMACPKGWEALEVLKAEDRAGTPLLKDASGKLKPVAWPEAIDAFVNRFKAIQKKHGPESLAFLSTGQIPLEEMALLGSLAKFGMGMVHGDGNTRQCMATAVVAYKQAFGFDAPPYTYRDFEESDVIFLVGSNLCIAHPILWERVLRNKRNPAIVVVDPRKTETAMAATHHLPIKPKSDLALFYGIAHLLLNEGWVDMKFIRAHTQGFDEFAKHLRDFTPEKVAARTGIREEAIREVAGLIQKGKRVSFWWTMGVNQSHQAVRTAQSLINLALMSGNIGKPGTGANSITGQCNAMGSRLFSNTTGLLGGHDFLNAGHRRKVAEILDIPLERIPQKNSWAYDQILEGIIRGDIKGLWIIATNSAHSWIHQSHAREALSRLDFLVVQDMYHNTESAQMADLVLPAAGWGEKEGTFINSERRYGVLKRVTQAPGKALADFFIFKLIARAWGVEGMFADWKTPADVFQSLKKITQGQPCDISGIKDYAQIERQGGIQWPYPEGGEKGSERRLFTDGKFYHEDGKAKFFFEKPAPLPEDCGDQFPLMLLTGRGSASQWHTQTRTSKSAILRKLYPEKIYAEIHPEDARERGIRNGMQVRLESRQGKIEARAQVVPTVSKGQVFVPMHYEKANLLTLAAFDPYSRQPSYKATPVQVSLVGSDKNV